MGSERAACNVAASVEAMFAGSARHGTPGGGPRTFGPRQPRVLARSRLPWRRAGARAAEAMVAAEAVAAAIGEAIESAALERITRDASLHSIVLPLDGLWAGLAGAGSIEAAHAVRTALIERGLAHLITVGTDVRAAYEDAFPDGDGVLEPLPLSSRISLFEDLHDTLSGEVGADDWLLSSVNLWGVGVLGRLF